MSTQQVTRSSVQYTEQYDRFVQKTKDYSQQYNSVYLARLSQMRQLLSSVARRKWGNQTTILPKIIDIESEFEKHENEAREYILIGTLWKDMALRGSVLDEFKENHGISGAVRSLYHIASKTDGLILEDESGRIALGGEMVMAHIGQMVTGVVVAVKGSVGADGVMQVSDWTFTHSLQPVTSPAAPISGVAISAEALQQRSVPAPQSGSKYILLVSGLHIGNPPLPTGAVPGLADQPAASEVSAQLLIDFLAGRLTANSYDVNLASKIARVIIAGDSVAPMDEAAARERQATYKHQRLAASPSKQLDILLAQLLTVCHVDIMPGEMDPSNLTMPQQPLHPCLFPHSCRFSSFNRVTNPYEAAFDGVAVLGHSGQPVSDIARQRTDCLPSAKPAEAAYEGEAEEKEAIGAKIESLLVTASTQEIAAVEQFGGVNALLERLQRGCTGEQSLNVLQDTLSWGHLCPTSPDTLSCYPFKDTDPFIVPDTRVPAVMFAGNQNEYATRLVTVDSGVSGAASQLVRLISVPSFAATGTAVLVDISSPDLVTTVVTFR